MKSLFLSIFFSLICCVSFSQEARIEIDSTSHNFGLVSRRGSDLRHKFKVRNVGTSSLVITEATTTCSCLKAKHPKSPIAPGGEGEIEVKYELQRKEVGVFHKVIKVMSNSSNGVLLLTIHGEAKDE